MGNHLNLAECKKICHFVTNFFKSLKPFNLVAALYERLINKTTRL